MDKPHPMGYNFRKIKFFPQNMDKKSVKTFSKKILNSLNDTVFNNCRV